MLLVRTVLLLMLAASASPSHGQVTPLGSSLEAFSDLQVVGTDLADQRLRTDTQNGGTTFLGPESVLFFDISPLEGHFASEVRGFMRFENPQAGSLTASGGYSGSPMPGLDSNEFAREMSVNHQYDFAIPGTGTMLVEGTVDSTSLPHTQFVAQVSVFSQPIGSDDFVEQVFEQTVIDQAVVGPSSFVFKVPLNTNSGIYRLQVRFSHNATTTFRSPSGGGTLSATWSIDPPISCPPDMFPPFNQDGVLNFLDMAEFLDRFAAMDPAADFAPAGSPDGLFNFFDVSAYIAAYNAGCP